MTSETVKDWASDYDIFDPQFVRDPYPVFDELRGKCPVAHSDRHGGSFMPTRYEDMFNIARDIEHFSSRSVLVVNPDREREEGEEGETGPYDEVGAPPITSDPPEHTWSRRLILPPFSKSSIERLEPGTHEFCRSLIDGFIEKGRC